MRCQCFDGQCAAQHEGQCDQEVEFTLVRHDMEQFKNDPAAEVTFCVGCADDAIESGLFRLKIFREMKR